MSNSVCVSFFSLFSFLASGFFSFFTFLNVSRHFPGPTVCVFHFLNFLSFFTIFHVLQCAFLIFHHFHCFSPYSRSNRFCFSFFTFLGVSRHISLPTVFIFIFHDFQFSRHIPGPRVCISHFPFFQCFLP